jgi:radical SAM protein with 4Fe4S-binding SPASM domain
MKKNGPPVNNSFINEKTVYQKYDSFLAMSGARIDPKLYARLRKLQTTLSTLPAEIQTVVKQACDDVLLNQKKLPGVFSLHPYVTEEMQRLNDNDLSRYLFYRYRYEIYPATQKLDEFPPCVQIEPSSICNYRCVFCYQTDTQLTQGRHGHMGMMDIDTFKLVVDQIEGKVEAVTLASRGEPLMAKSIIPMLEYLSGKFLGLKINTNASFLTEEKAHAILAAEPNTLVFSADASDKELYSKLRVNGNLETVLENVRLFNEIKTKHYPNSRTITRVSGVRFSEEQNFEKIEKFWHSFVDQVAFVAYNPWESAYEAPENTITDHCSDLWRRTFVWWDGVVNPCDVDYKSTLSVGNIKKETLNEIWTGDRYKSLRHLHSNSARCTLTPCNGCSLI